jgi:hypothetical protein
VSEPIITTSELASLLRFAIGFEGDECWTNEVGDLFLELLRYILAVTVREHVFLLRRDVLGVYQLTASPVILVQGLFDGIRKKVLQEVPSQVRSRFYYYPE